MAEIIKREIKAEKITIDVDWNTNVQIAINDWGHLTIRIWKITGEEKEVKEDILIVFNKQITSRIVDFITNLHHGRLVTWR